MKQGARFMGVCLFAVGLIGSPGEMRADTVVLRNGRKYSNVKTRLTKGRIIITDKRGRVRRYRARDIKLMLPGAVDWKVPVRKTPPRRVIKKKPPIIKPPVKKTPVKVVKKEPLKQAAPAKTEPRKVAGTTPAGASGLPYGTPASRAGESVLPGWSGFYNGGRPRLGYLFSGLEIFAIGIMIPWLKQATPLERDNLPLVLTVASALPPLPPPPGAPPPPPPGSTGNAIRNLPRTLPLFTALGLVVHPVTGSTLQRSDYTARRNELIGFGLAVVLTHAALAYFLEPPAAGADRTASDSSNGSIIFSLGSDSGSRQKAAPGVVPGRGLKLGFSLKF